MTPERWRQIDDLFDGSLRLIPTEREAWLRAACGEDEGLRAEVARLLDEDARAVRTGFLSPPEVTNMHLDATASWSSPWRRPPAGGTGPVEHGETISVDEAGGFAPKAAICCRSESGSLERGPFAGAAAAARPDDHLSTHRRADGLLEVCHRERH